MPAARAARRNVRQSAFLLTGPVPLRPGYGTVQAAVAVGAMNAFLAKTLLTRPKDVLKIGEVQTASSAQMVLSAFDKASPTRQKAFIQAVRNRGYMLKASPKIVLAREASAAPLLEFLAENLDVLESIDTGPSDGTLKLGASFTANETDELSAQATRIITNAENKAHLVIIGHTHEVVDLPGYINTGSWTRSYKVQKKERLRPWTMLQAGSWKNFPYQLNYALVRPAAQPAALLQNK